MSIASQEQPVGKRGNSAGNGKFEPNRKEFEQARTKGLKAQRPQKKVLRGAYFSGYRFQGSLDDRDLEDFQQGSGISRARRTKVEEREMIGGRRAKLATGVSSISYRAEARRKERKEVEGHWRGECVRHDPRTMLPVLLSFAGSPLHLPFAFCLLPSTRTRPTLSRLAPLCFRIDARRMSRTITADRGSLGFGRSLASNAHRFFCLRRHSISLLDLSWKGGRQYPRRGKLNDEIRGHSTG
ncbi:hypothetical protein KM043_001508 [Ampulex compressa]|nr:hypothetical protein KM043_001508 [Ampulex compressa]